MRYSIKNFLPVVALLLATSCHTPYRLISVDRTRVLVDNRYDATTLEIVTFVQGG